MITVSQSRRRNDAPRPNPRESSNGTGVRGPRAALRRVRGRPLGRAENRRRRPRGTLDALAGVAYRRRVGSVVGWVLPPPVVLQEALGGASGVRQATKTSGQGRHVPLPCRGPALGALGSERPRRASDRCRRDEAPREAVKRWAVKRWGGSHSETRNETGDFARSPAPGESRPYNSR